MSSLAERLRTRTEKRLYNEQDSDDDDFVPSKKTPRSKAEKLTKVAAKKSVCQACGKSGNLLDCSTCTCSFHQKCLFYYRKASADNWRCPECVNPLSAVCKILDAKTRSSAADENDFPQPGTHNVGTRHYLVKWKGLSYLHCSWVPEEELKKACKVDSMLKSRLNYFYKQLDSTVDTIDEDWIAIRSEWTTVDRIIGTRKIGDECEYFVKWEELPYDECSWEFESDISTFRPQIERYKMIQSRSGRRRNKNLNRDSKDVKSRMKDFQHFEKSPQFLSGGTLHPFQLEGLNFLRYSWLKNTHVILADEMGLGKTIQSIAFLASLFEENLSPHLVIAPLSTLRNWEREFSMWAPQLNVVMYSGSAEARSIIRQYEFFYPYAEIKKHKKKTFHNDNRKKQAKIIKFDVLLTSYEMINLDSSSLKCINWECMIVDEGHRLKNKDSKLFTQLKHFTSNHRVLLTGTPLQNNLDELFILMHYLDDGKFPSIEDFREEFKDINQEEQIARLHKILAPHLLRRVKKDVMKDLPSKKELILRVDLSNKQKEYYKAILTRNYQTLARRGGSQISLNNVVMELRKLCCHVYMLKVEDPDATSTNASDGLRELLEFSGKMQLLDKMMLRLKEQGHRVLIYSQFQHMLDLLEDYLSYRNWSYERIDGSISGAERQIRIDRFNAKNSTRFCFVLSTRAGGLGINLATADTVIIYDSDWNPHADLQAMARAHRLGQANKVMIYRLITRGTIEERMMQLTKKKMVLEHIVVGRLKERTVNQEELDDIIRYGSKDLFVDESDETGKVRQIHYDDAAVDRLLNRDEISVDEPSIDEEDDDLLKAFKVANFELIDEVEAAITREEEAKKSMSEKNSTSNTDRSIFWTELLRDKYDVIQFEESMNMGKGKRNRKQMPAAEEDVPHASSSDDDYSTEDDFSDTDIEEPGQASRRRVPPRKRSGVDLTEPHALMEGEGRHLRVRGFNQIQRNGFLQVLLRFGFGKYDWKEFVPRLKGKSMQEVHDYGCLFMEHLTEDLNDSPTFSDGVPKEGVRVDDVLVRLGVIQSIKEKLDILLENPSALLFPDDIQSWFTGMKGRLWKEEHDILLLKAILTHGYGRWQAIIEDEDTGLAEIVRQELNLPGMHGPVVGANQTTVNENSGCKENEISEPPASKPFLYHFREIQRKIADYIKKRYQLLEKAMNMELVKEKTCGGKTSELIHDSNVDPKVTEVLGPESTHPSALSKGLPIIEPIALQGHGCDDKVCLDLIRLYNKMCNLVVANTPDTFQMHCGDSSVSSKLSNNLSQLHAVCEGVLRVLSAPDCG